MTGKDRMQLLCSSKLRAQVSVVGQRNGKHSCSGAQTVEVFVVCFVLIPGAGCIAW